jgi:hypothetical protein
MGGHARSGTSRIPRPVKILPGTGLPESAGAGTECLLGAVPLRPVGDFGVGTVCGLGGDFYSRDDVIEILGMYAALAAPIAAI